MFLIGTVMQGHGNWVGTLSKVVNGRGDTEQIGGINITNDKFHLNIREGKTLTAGEMVILFAEILNAHPRASGFPFTMKVVENPDS
jgi:hypothetical protein